MIKLKDIVGEIMEPKKMRSVWTSEKGVPDEVINFIHELMARLMPEVGHNTGKYFEVKKIGDGVEWLIRNRYTGTALFYSPKEDVWYIYMLGYKKTRPLPKEHLKIVIKNWIP